MNDPACLWPRRPLVSPSFVDGRQISPMDSFRFLKFRYAPHRSWKAVAILPLMGLALALAGPFGSYVSMNIWERCAHFALCFTAIGGLILESAYRLARRYFAGNWPLWAALSLDAALVVPAATIVWGSLHVFGPAALAAVPFTTLLWQNLFIILVVQASITLAAWVQHSRLPPPAPSVEDFPLAHCLPFALKRSPVLALTSEDHYLRVYTARGEALIHMTLAEAIELLKDGFQIHRSHWVHDGAVKDYRKVQVELITGLKLPLSRHRRKAFEDWLKTVGLA